MRFHGQPFLHVIDYDHGKEVFCFDETGVYDTDDEKLIAWMKKTKPHIRAEAVEEKQEPIKPKNTNKPKKPTK
jgi:hypothetical protein